MERFKCPDFGHIVPEDKSKELPPIDWFQVEPDGLVVKEITMEEYQAVVVERLAARKLAKRSA